MDKKETRQYIRTLKKNFTETEKQMESERIWRRMEQHPLFLQSNNILIYWSMPDEVKTPDFIRKWQDKKRFILPCVNGAELDLKYFRKEGEMRQGERFLIPEPTGEPLDDYGVIELAIVPGMAFDPQCHRLGRGRGYYDKTLRKIHAPKIGVCFEFQYLDEVPVDDLDIPMDGIIHG